MKENARIINAIYEYQTSGFRGLVIKKDERTLWSGLFMIIAKVSLAIVAIKSTASNRCSSTLYGPIAKSASC